MAVPPPAQCLTLGSIGTARDKQFDTHAPLVCKAKYSFAWSAYANVCYPWAPQRSVTSIVRRLAHAEFLRERGNAIGINLADTQFAAPSRRHIIVLLERDIPFHRRGLPPAPIRRDGNVHRDSEGERRRWRVEGDSPCCQPELKPSGLPIDNDGRSRRRPDSSRQAAVAVGT